MPLVLANIFQPLIDAFEAVLVFIHDQLGVGWGTSIILLTVVVRFALLPLAIKQFRSMQGLQRIAPEMKKLQEKYKEDKQRQQQELMALYKEHKVNPFGSCLPLLAQLPVFLSLFYLLQKDLRREICDKTTPCGETPASEFLFIPDITDKATGGVLIALIVLYIGSQLLSSILMANQMTDRNQRLLMIGLPFVFTVFIINFPAGLILYWITTNFWTVAQQYTLRRVFGTVTPAAATAGPGTGKTSVVPAEGKGRAKGKAAAAEAPAEPKPKRESAPPPPPRRKKKRSGRRR